MLLGSTRVQHAQSQVWDSLADTLTTDTVPKRGFLESSWCTLDCARDGKNQILQNVILQRGIGLRPVSAVRAMSCLACRSGFCWTMGLPLTLAIPHIISSEGVAVAALHLLSLCTWELYTLVYFQTTRSPRHPLLPPLLQAPRASGEKSGSNILWLVLPNGASGRQVGQYSAAA